MKKLTGREAVIALMENKCVRRLNEVVKYDEEEDCFYNEVRSLSFVDIVKCDDWEIIREPMIWESENERVEYTDAYGDILQVPSGWYGKRVKVRIEEILE